MRVDRCTGCGFDDGAWTDAAAVAAVAELPDRWTSATAGLSDGDLARRPIAGMWSIAEYVDHMRETTFFMRFMLDVAVDTPGTDLGPRVEPRFDPKPRAVDASAALGADAAETEQLRARLVTVPAEAWDSSFILDGERLDVHWVVRNTAHEATHHLDDVQRLRAALDGR